MPPSTSPGKGQPHTSESLSDEIDVLSDEVEALRAAYEQYFLGIERKPPTLRHDKLKKRVVAIMTTTVKQTAVKFKAQSLNAKVITYERLWTRTLKGVMGAAGVVSLSRCGLDRLEGAAALVLPGGAEGHDRIELSRETLRALQRP